jgi:transposase
MHILGIDVSKEALVGVLIDKSFKVKRSYSLLNTSEAIVKLLDEVSIRHKHLIVGCESTAEYHLDLA